MPVIAHVSDFHFGKDVKQTEKALIKELKKIHPVLTVISGDLTGRAMLRQFKRTRQFIDNLPKPYMIVPGNHDVPVAFAHRFLAPLARYRYYINRQVSPVHIEKDFCVLGLNTARSVAIEAGGFSKRQLQRAERLLASFPKDKIKIIVQHHPFIRPPQKPGFRRVVVGAEMALQTFERSKVDLILAGHFHRPHIADIRAHYPSVKRAMIHSQVGIALMKLAKTDIVSFNVIDLNKKKICISVHAWNGRSFRKTTETKFVKSKNGWECVSPKIKEIR